MTEKTNCDDKRSCSVRYKSPTRYDVAPFNTLCQVEEGDDDRQFPDRKTDSLPKMFVQISENEDRPCWVDMGELLLGANLRNIQKDDLRKEWIRLYREHFKEDQQ